MAAFYWIKLYDEILDDPKMGRLSDGAHRLCINLFLLAGRQDNRDGRLPDFEDIGWLLRLSPDDLQSYWGELERADIVSISDGNPHVNQFSKRQAAVSDAERMKQYRERKRIDELEESDEAVTEEKRNSDASVTKRNTDTDTDTDTDKNEKREDAPLIPPIVESIPFVPVASKSKAPRSPVELRIDAILEVCGMRRAVPAHLRKAETAAVELSSFPPDEIVTRYQHVKNPNGEWYWYRDDWRGAKGQQPKPRDIVETIGKKIMQGHVGGAVGKRQTAADSYTEVFGS